MNPPARETSSSSDHGVTPTQGRLEAGDERRIRQYLWLSHGHTGVYGDDGEMQCARCAPTWDYKRAPLADVLDAVDRARMEQLRESSTSLAALEGAQQNEGELLRWFSDRLTGGAASTWDEIKHALDVVLEVADD